MPKKSPNLTDQTEKKQNRFAFCCIANILYIIPCLSCLAMAIMLDGFKLPFIFAIVTMVLNLPVSLIILNQYKKKKSRTPTVAVSIVMLALHLITAPVVGTWYIIMAPSFVLYCLIIAWSDVITEK